MRRIALCSVTTFLTLALAHCGRPSQEDLLLRGEALCREAQWDAAIPLLKQRLLQKPNDAGAHFYLGRCYLNRVPPWLEIAQGELETALNQFIRQGRRSTIERFSDVYFELICHIENAKVFLRQLDKLDDLNASPSLMQEKLDACRVSLEEAKRVLPGVPEVTQLESLCHTWQARIFLMQAMALAGNAGETGHAAFRDLLNKARASLDAARRITPDSKDIANLDTVLRALERENAGLGTTL